MNKRIWVAGLGLLSVAGFIFGLQFWMDSAPRPTDLQAKPYAGSAGAIQVPTPLTSAAAKKAESLAPPVRRLVGVIAKGKQYSHAVIADAKTQEQSMYTAGDAVAPDNALLVSIHADYVLLEGPGYGRIVLRLQSGSEEDLADESGTALTEYPEDAELDRQLEEAFGPDPYLDCERYTTGAEEQACDERIDAEIDRRVEACDDVDDKDAYADCLDRAQSLQ